MIARVIHSEASADRAALLMPVECGEARELFAELHVLDESNLQTPFEVDSFCSSSYLHES